MDGWNGLDADFDIGFGKPTRPKKSKLVERDSRRKFTKLMEKEILARQKSKCARCGKTLDLRTVKFHHKKAWALGGKTTPSNGMALHPHCHDVIHHEEQLKKLKAKSKTQKKSKSQNFNDDLMNPLGSKKDMNIFGL